MWGRLATCAAVGYRRRSTAKAAGADCQSAAGYQPAPQNLVRQPTPAQFFMGFRGPKAHSNRPRKAMVCPTGCTTRPRGYPLMPLIRSFRAQLTALYLAFFSLLFVLFSIFLYSELSRSLTARLDDTLASEAETAAVLFPDELQEMKGDAVAAAREVIGELKVRGDFVTIREGSRVLATSPQSAPGPRDRSAARTVQAAGHTYQLAVSAPLDAIHA